MTYDRLKDLDLFRREQTEARHDNNCQVCRRLLQGEGNELSPVPNGLRQRVMGLNCTKGISHLGGCGISVTRGFEEQSRQTSVKNGLEVNALGQWTGL